MRPRRELQLGPKYQGIVIKNPPLKVQKFRPNRRSTIFRQIWEFFSSAAIFGQIWPNFSGAAIFLQIFDPFLLIYTVNPYYFCTFFHQIWPFWGALIFRQIWSKFSGAAIFRQIPRIWAGCNYCRGGFQLQYPGSVAWCH